jgi:hypothetical protein
MLKGIACSPFRSVLKLGHHVHGWKHTAFGGGLEAAQGQQWLRAISHHKEMSCVVELSSRHFFVMANRP